MATDFSQQCFNTVRKWFNGCNEQAWQWFKNIDSSLGITPISMIKSGESAKLLKHIKSKIEHQGRL